MAEKPHISGQLSILIDLLSDDEMTDEVFIQLFWHIRHEITARICQYEENHLRITGELSQGHAWSDMAKLRFLGYFGNEEPKFTMKRLAFIEQAMPDPDLQRVVHDLMSDISMAMVWHPENYQEMLRKGRKFLEFAAENEQRKKPEV